MNYDLKIYFVENFHGIQYFLSIIDPKEKNLIITSGNPHLEKFLDEILPEQERLIIPRIPSYRFFVLPFLLLLWRWKYSKILARKDVHKAYFFSKGNNIHFFAVLAQLQKSKCDIYFIDGSGGKFIETPVDETSLLQKLYNLILGICCGQDLIRYKCWGWIHFGLKHFNNFETVRLLEWEKIAKKFNLPTEKVNNAVLIVDGPIQDIPGVDISKTQKKLVKYFSENLKKQIHIKPHIHSNITSFLGTSLENKVKTLPRHIPAELIILKYDEIYFFASAACYGQNNKKLYSLSKMLIFESAEAELNYWKLFNDYYQSESVVLL